MTKNSAESIAGTLEEGRAQIGSLVMHGEARAGPLPLQFGEATFAPSQPARVAMGPVGCKAGRFEPLMAQEAATITIELCR